MSVFGLLARGGTSGADNGEQGAAAQPGGDRFSHGISAKLLRILLGLSGLLVPREGRKRISSSAAP
jgi:hypothetical protein